MHSVQHLHRASIRGIQSQLKDLLRTEEFLAANHVLESLVNIWDQYDALPTATYERLESALVPLIQAIFDAPEAMRPNVIGHLVNEWELLALTLQLEPD